MTTYQNDLNSSFLESATYDSDTSVLTIKFKNGKEYPYADVPKEIYDDLITAESAGTFFSREIKSKFKAPEEDNAG